jgi:two-component system cell cycle sensor histidine kinase/response regulator CckA
MEAAAAPELPALSPLFNGRGRILVVEDEHALREAITDQLRNHGYEVLAAGDGIEALDLLSRHPDLSVLVCDLIMPRMGGRELVRLATERLPHLNCIYMSGHAEQNLDEAEGALSSAEFMQKPFSMSALLTRIAELDRRSALLRSLPASAASRTQIQ